MGISFFCYLQCSLLAKLRLVLAYEKPSGKVLQLQRQKCKVMEMQLRSRVGGMGASVPGLGVAACCWSLVLPEHISPERVCRAGSATGGFIPRARALKHFFRTQ